jgi:hypothetical protein
MSDEEFLRSFEECTLPKAEWTHAAHLRMAWIYLRRHPFEEALARARAGIQKYNASQGSKGYRETITQFFMRMISHRLGAGAGALSFDEFLASNQDLYRPEISVRRKHYSDQVWLSERAKAEFVPPDLLPLPGTGGGGSP